MQTLINKVGMAVGAFIGVMAFSWAGINPEATPAIQPEGEQLLWNILILAGAISMVGTVIPMFFYTITEKRQAEMVAEIEARKQK
jgi:Na+/melibiose symporter-like transporter